MDVLMHICCAPCSVACISSLRDEGIEPHGFWYNPNIHPVTEYRMRRDTLKEYAASVGMKLDINDTYGLRSFVASVISDLDGRCGYCYSVRMDETARYAALNGFEYFTTTLLISPYQKHDLLKKTAEEAAAKYGVKFLYRDFRPLFKSGQEEARKLGLYMQKYCGCIFSEEERYRAKQMKRERENRE